MRILRLLYFKLSSWREFVQFYVQNIVLTSGLPTTVKPSLLILNHALIKLRTKAGFMLSPLGHDTTKDGAHDETKYRSRYYEEHVDTEYEEKKYYAKYCRDQNVNPTLIQAATPIVHIPKPRNDERFTYGEKVKVEPHSPPPPQKRRRTSHDDEEVYSGGEFLEAEKADEIPCHDPIEVS